MNNVEHKICKTKTCDNPVLNGKYCEHCTQTRREKRNQMLAVGGSVTLAFGGLVLKVIFSKPSGDSDA